MVLLLQSISDTMNASIHYTVNEAGNYLPSMQVGVGNWILITIASVSAIFRKHFRTCVEK